MSLNEKLRILKNKLILNTSLLAFFVKAINAPVVGSIYDFFYFKHIRNRVQNSKLSLTIEPNNICNLKCVMCPYKRMKRKKETMSMALFKKIVDEANELGCIDVHLTQYNEPFTDRHLFERLSYLRKMNMRSWFYSNAMLLDKNLREELLKNPADLVRFSVDGAKKETLESIRVGTDYNKVVGNITKLYEERNKLGKKLPIIEVFFTLLEQNKNEASDFLKFWDGKCDFASIYPADSRESGRHVNLNYKNFKPYPCFNPKRVLVLSNGKVALCCVDIDGRVELGDTNNQTLKEIINSKKFQEIHSLQMKRNCNIALCKNCSKLYIDSMFSWWAGK